MAATGEGWQGGIVREFVIDRQTLLYLKWINNKDLLYRTWNSAQCYEAAWMGGEYGEERLPTKSLQSCLTLCNPMNCSPPSSSVHGILQARILEDWHFLLQGIFPIQGSNPHLLCLLHWQVGSLPLAPLGKSLGENRYMYLSGCIPSLVTWNYHNVANQLYPNTK